MAWIPGGTFAMGSARHYPEEAPVREVSVDAFWLDEHPELLADATWANWDCDGALWVARPGLVEQYTRHDLGLGTPSFAIDVEPFDSRVSETTRMT